MSQFTTFFIKEWREAWRSFKLLWMPLVFILLGISDPLANYFMDDILAAVGNMPEGFEMTMPEFTASDILAASTSQFQSIGMILFVAIFSSYISRERANGTATLLYVRAISYTNYFLSKWVMGILLAFICVALGYGGSIYYTVLLYGEVSVTAFLLMVLTYFLWTVFVISFCLAMSAAFSTGVAVTLSVIVVLIGSIIDSMIGSYWVYSPWKLANYAVQVITDEVNWQHYTWTIIITLLLSVIFILIGINISKKNASKTSI